MTMRVVVQERNINDGDLYLSGRFVSSDECVSAFRAFVMSSQWCRRINLNKSTWKSHGRQWIERWNSFNRFELAHILDSKGEQPAAMSVTIPPLYTVIFSVCASHLAVRRAAIATAVKNMIEHELVLFLVLGRHLQIDAFHFLIESHSADEPHHIHVEPIKQIALIKGWVFYISLRNATHDMRRIYECIFRLKTEQFEKRF